MISKDLRSVSIFFVSFHNLNWVDEPVVDHSFLDEPCRYEDSSALFKF
jgi:hypothetical protein